MIKRFSGILILFFVALGVYYVYQRFIPVTKPSAEVSHHVLMKEVSALGKMELVKFHFKDVVEYTKEQTKYKTLNQFLPTAKAVLIISGEAVGCMDMTRISSQDIKIKKDTIILQLPAPELCYYRIDHSNSKVYDVSDGYLVEEGLIVGEAFRSAEDKMKTAALQSGILEETNTNARKILAPMLQKISGKVVLLETK